MVLGVEKQEERHSPFDCFYYAIRPTARQIQPTKSNRQTDILLLNYRGAS